MPEVDDIIAEKPALTSLVHMPHDSAFKASMSDVRVAWDFVFHHAPKHLLKRLDRASFKMCSGKFVDPELRKSETDVLYCAKLKPKKGSSKIQWIYFLIEHQSSADRWLPFRISQYVFRIMEAHRKQYPDSHCLPIVCPIVLYNGDSAYPYSTSLLDLFCDEKELASTMFLGDYEFILVNLYSIDDVEIKTHRWCGLMEFVLKNAKKIDPLELIKQAAASWVNRFPESAGDYSAAMINYVIDQGGVSDAVLFMKQVRGFFPKKVEENIMSAVKTLKEWFKEEGLEEGRQEGRQEGRKEGRREGRRETILILLKNLDNDKSKVTQLMGLSAEKIDELLKDPVQS